MRRAFCLLLLGLTACASAPQHETRWYKAGSTNQDFAMDQGQCRAQAFSAPGLQTIQVLLIYNSCMQGKGWDLH